MYVEQFGKEPLEVCLSLANQAFRQDPALCALSGHPYKLITMVSPHLGGAGRSLGPLLVALACAASVSSHQPGQKVSRWPGANRPPPPPCIYLEKTPMISRHPGLAQQIS